MTELLSYTRFWFAKFLVELCLTIGMLATILFVVCVHNFIERHRKDRADLTEPDSDLGWDDDKWWHN